VLSKTVIVSIARMVIMGLNVQPNVQKTVTGLVILMEIVQSVKKVSQVINVSKNVQITAKVVVI
jgi:hypothetical protein